MKGFTEIDAAPWGVYLTCNFCGLSTRKGESVLGHYPSCMTKQMSVEQATKQIEELCAHPDTPPVGKETS